MYARCQIPNCQGAAVTKTMVHPSRIGGDLPQIVDVCAAHSDGWENLSEPPPRHWWRRLPLLRWRI